MYKENVTLQSLMADVSSYYTNLVASDDWKLEINKHAQIIALTTQVLELNLRLVKSKLPPSLLVTLEKFFATKMIISRDGISQKLTMATNLIWFIRMALSTIGVISTSILIVNSWGCTFSINQQIMMNGRRRRSFSTLGKRAMANLPLQMRNFLLVLLLPYLLLQLTPHQNYFWPNLFRKH